MHAHAQGYDLKSVPSLCFRKISKIELFSSRGGGGIRIWKGRGMLVGNFELR